MTAGKLGPEATRAMRMSIEGSKKKKIAVLIGVYLDAGKRDPSISELARRAKLRPIVVVGVVAALEKAGILEVQRGDIKKQERNRYRLLDGGRAR